MNAEALTPQPLDAEELDYIKRGGWRGDASTIQRRLLATISERDAKLADANEAQYETRNLLWQFLDATDMYESGWDVDEVVAHYNLIRSEVRSFLASSLGEKKQ